MKCALLEAKIVTTQKAVEKISKEVPALFKPIRMLGDYEVSAGKEGTDELVIKYRKQTPGDPLYDPDTSNTIQYLSDSNPIVFNEPSNKGAMPYSDGGIPNASGINDGIGGITNASCTSTNNTLNNSHSKTFKENTDMEYNSILDKPIPQFSTMSCDHCMGSSPMTPPNAEDFANITKRINTPLNIAVLPRGNQVVTNLVGTNTEVPVGATTENPELKISPELAAAISQFVSAVSPK